MIIVDASVAAKWFLDEPGSDAARSVLEEGPLGAPDLILPETVNALWAAARRGRLPPAGPAQAASLLASRLTRLEPSANLIAAAADLARRADHTVYDCLYLALGRLAASPVVTADRRLAEAAETLGVEARML